MKEIQSVKITVSEFLHFYKAMYEYTGIGAGIVALYQNGRNCESRALRVSTKSRVGTTNYQEKTMHITDVGCL